MLDLRESFCGRTPEGSLSFLVGGALVENPQDIMIDFRLD
jgi:hypothetical protein